MKRSDALAERTPTVQSALVGNWVTLREEDDRYVLPYRNRRVNQIVVDHALTLVLDGHVTLTIESPAMLTQGAITAPDGASDRLVPGTQQVEKALALFGTHVLSSVAFKSGALRVVFSNGLHISVFASEEYEAWQARGPETLRIVSLPGGELAVWR